MAYSSLPTTFTTKSILYFLKLLNAGLVDFSVLCVWQSLESCIVTIKFFHRVKLSSLHTKVSLYSWMDIPFLLVCPFTSIKKAVACSPVDKVGISWYILIWNHLIKEIETIFYGIVISWLPSGFLNMAFKDILFYLIHCNFSKQKETRQIYMILLKLSIANVPKKLMHAKWLSWLH